MLKVTSTVAEEVFTGTVEAMPKHSLGVILTGGYRGRYVLKGYDTAFVLPGDGRSGATYNGTNYPVLAKEMVRPLRRGESVTVTQEGEGY